jgi:hypothetical protein
LQNAFLATSLFFYKPHLYMKKAWLSALILITVTAFAQNDTTGFPQFEDVDSKPVKRYATNKVLYTTPNRFISVGYEHQGAHNYSSNQFPQGNRRFNGAGGPRIAFSAPVISRTRGILNISAAYWRTSYQGINTSPEALYNSLDKHGLHNATLGTTFFKPLNERNFLILQASADASFLPDEGVFGKSDALTYSATAVYGWKRSDSLMWGLGVARTYRLGRLIHVPVLLYNRTFNDRWGVEVLLPARAAVRRNFNPKTLATLGFELEGSQYAWRRRSLATPPSTEGTQFFLQRGEIKPRINVERNLFGFWWLAVQAGVRVNGRFVVVDRYNGKEKHEVITAKPGTPFYFNVTLNLVSL